MPSTEGGLGIEAAARLCGVSDETIRRRLRAGRLPGARRVGGPASEWRIPIGDLVEAGFEIGATPSQEVERDIVALQRNVEVLQQRLEERDAHLAALRSHISDLRALLGIAGGQQ